LTFSFMVLSLFLRGKTWGGGEAMKNAVSILLLLAVLGLSACAAGTPDRDDGRYYRTRGYPEDYFNNRPDYYFSAPRPPDPADMEDR
jgi:hypothetical protein